MKVIITTKCNNTINSYVAFNLKVVVEVDKSKEISKRFMPQLTEYHIDRGSLSTGTWNK
ncbi:MAG: hypothetical protein J6Y71_09665 [Ruminococcus sp.]|nr:hypothetical protein [Ruminococcus sp.]